MAANTLQAKRYAQAVFEIAQERQEFDKWRSDLQLLSNLMDNAEIAAVIDNPKYSSGDKSQLLQSQVKDVGPLALNLAYLLISHGRFSLITDISLEYVELMEKYFGIEKAEVITAVPLDEKEKQSLIQHLENILNKKVILTLKTDPEIIGGMVIRVGGKLIDGSTRSQLMALKSELANADI